MFSKLKHKSVKASSDFRSLEQKPVKRTTPRPKKPKRPNHMAYRAVSRQAPPGGGK